MIMKETRFIIAINSSLMQGNSSESIYTHRKATLGEVLSKPDILGITIFLFIQICSSVIANLLVVRTVYVTRRLHTPAYYFVASLAVADFLVGLLGIPVSLLYNVTFHMNGRWVFGEVVCDAWILANLWFCIASIFSLCAVTWDRYVAVTSPLHYIARMSNRHVIRLVVAIWLTSFIVAVANCYGIKTSPSRILCEIQGFPLSYTIPDFVLLYMVPLTAILFVNICIVKAVTSQLKRIHDQTPRVIEIPEVDEISVSRVSTSNSSRSLKDMKKEIKTFRTFLIVTGSFFMSWTPFFFIILIDPIYKVHGSVMYICVILTYINSSSNPLVYSIFNRDFRQAMFSSLKYRY